DSLRGEIANGISDHAVKSRSERGTGDRRSRAPYRTHVFVREIAEEHSGGAQHGTARRDDHLRDADFLGDQRRMNRTGPSSDHQRKTTRIMATGDRDLTDCCGHVDVYDLEHGRSCALSVTFELDSNVLLNLCFSSLARQLDLAAQEVIRID